MDLYSLLMKQFLPGSIKFPDSDSEHRINLDDFLSSLKKAVNPMILT